MRSVLLAVLALLGALIVPRSGRAWTEARPAGMVTEYQVDRDGDATVTVRIQWRVLAGRLHQFDLAELPTDLSLLEASATNAVGAPVPLSTRSPWPGRLEISLADAQGGVRRGTVDVVVRYTTSLRAQGLVRRAGTDAVLFSPKVPLAEILKGFGCFFQWKNFINYRGDFTLFKKGAQLILVLRS